MARHRAIACVKVRAARLHALDHRFADLHGSIAKLPLDAVGAIVPRTTFDGLDSGSGNQLQSVASLESDSLHSQVAGDAVGDVARGPRASSAHHSGFVPRGRLLDRLPHP